MCIFKQPSRSDSVANVRTTSKLNDWQLTQEQTRFRKQNVMEDTQDINIVSLDK